MGTRTSRGMSDGRYMEMSKIRLLLSITFLAAWLTHIVVAIAAKAWLFMIVGAMIFPVAITHGFSVWLGYHWL